jgi:hypothetical protein
MAPIFRAGFPPETVRMSLLHSPRTRWGAFAAHLGLSILLLGSIAATAFLLWFPAGLHLAAKLDKLLAVMLGVDIVAGPLLTLLLYRPGKRGLKLDLAVVALLQVAFLSYGLHTLWRSRPLFLVGSQQAFALVFANELPDDAASKARAAGSPRFRGSAGPWLVGVDLSSDAARDEFLFAYLAGDVGPLRDPALFVPYAGLREQVLAKARPLAPDVPAAGHPRDAVKSVALMSARSRSTAMLLDARTGMPLQAVEVTPQKPTQNVSK